MTDQEKSEFRKNFGKPPKPEKPRQTSYKEELSFFGCTLMLAIFGGFLYGLYVWLGPKFFGVVVLLLIIILHH